MPRLLLVEDEIGAIAALRRILGRSGFEVLVATNLPDALLALENQKPEAILLSATLQGESTPGLVEAIRAVDVSRPILVLGDAGTTGETSLPKPIDPVRLLDLVRGMVPSFPRAGGTAPPGLEPAPADPPIPRAIPTSEDLSRRRELAAKSLAEAQARRRAIDAARIDSDSSAAAAPVARPPSGDALGTGTPEVRGTPPESSPAHPRAPRGEASGARPLDDALFGGDTPGLSLDAGADLPALSASSAAQASSSAPERVVPSPSAPALFPPAAFEGATEGSLDRHPPIALIVACHRSRLTGQLRLDQGAVQRVLFFNDGRFVGASSTSPEERLEALSYRRGLLTREQQRLLRHERDTPTRRLALLMVERGYLKPAELFPLVQERVEEVVFEAMGGLVGSYEVRPETVPDDERVSLPRSPLSLVTEGVRRKYLMEKLVDEIGGPATLLRPVKGPELASFGLTARERRLAQAVDGLRNIEELLFESGIPSLPGLQILYALLAGGAVEIAVRGLAEPSSPEADARIDLSRVAEKYEQVRASNYFEVLGVSPSATRYEIEQAYERLAREFEPGRFRELRRPEVPQQLEEIQRVLAEARDILADEGLRSEYRAHLRRA